MNAGNTYERISFRMFALECCGHLLCWVNSRFPSFCPNCGKSIYPSVKGQAVIIDENAAIRYSAKPLEKLK